MTNGELIRNYDDAELTEFLDDLIVAAENAEALPWHKWYSRLDNEDVVALQINNNCDMMCAWLCAEID